MVATTIRIELLVGLNRTSEIGIKKGSGTVSGTAHRLLRTMVPDPFLCPKLLKKPGLFDEKPGFCYARLMSAVFAIFPIAPT